MLVQEHFHAVNQVALQFVHILQSFFLHALLAFRTSFPGLFTSLVTSYMDVFGRKQLHHLCQHIFQKGEGLFIADTEIRTGICLSLTRKFRISRQSFLGMRRHLYLRDKGNVTVGSITHQFTYVILRIITAVSAGSALLAIFPSVGSIPPSFPHGFRTPCGKLRQPWIFLDFNSPSGSIRQVQVQPVYFITCQRIHLLHQKLFRAEMPGHVNHKAAIIKARSILYLDSRHLPNARSGRFCQLKQGLQPIE